MAWLTLTDGTLSKDDARKKMEAVNAELVEVAEQLSAAAFDKRRHTLSHREIQALKDRAKDFSARMGEAPLSTARQLLGEWLDTIVIDGDARCVTVSRWPIPSFARRSQARRAPIGKIRRSFRLPRRRRAA